MRALVQDLPLQQVGADLAQFFRIIGIGVAVQPGGIDLETAGQHRFVHGTKKHLAADGGAAEVHSVVALFQRDEFCALRLAGQFPVLARQLQRGFVRIRTPGAEEGPLHVLRGKHAHQPLCEFDDGHIAGVAESGVIRQFIQLVVDGLFHFFTPVPDVDTPQTAL